MTSPPHPPPLPQPDPLVPAWHALRRWRHLTVPLGTIPVMAIAGEAAGASAAHMDIGIGGGVATLAMLAAAPLKWDRRIEQWYARLSAAAAAGWLETATWLGLTRWTFGAGCLLCVAWGIPWWHHKRPRDDKARGVTSEWAAWWSHHADALGLFGSGVVEATSLGPAETLRVQLWRGRQTVGDVERARPLLESALGGYVPHDGVRVAKVQGNPSQVMIHLRRSNPLAAEPIRWTPDLVPQSINEPAAIGIDEAGRWKRVKLLVNWLIIGRTRSGKSNQLSMLLAAITSCPDAAPPWLIAMKGGRAARPWMEALGWCATGIEEARILLRTAVAEIEARGMHAYDGEEQVTPTEECPALFVVIDEANGVTSEGNGDAECARHVATISSQGNGVAVFVVVSTQHGALAESVRTEQTRANLLARLCFAVSEARHGVFALGDDYTRIDASKLEEAGSFYAKLGKHAPSEPHRAPELDHDLVRRIAAANSAVSRPPLRLYASDLQADFDARWLRLPAVFRKLAPQYRAAVVSAARAGSADPEVPAPLAPERPDTAGVVSVPARLARIDADVMSLPDWPSLAGVALPSEAELVGDMRKRKLRFARDLMSAGEAGISPEELHAHTGLSRSWIHGQLKALIEDGAVTRISRGIYRAIPGRNAWEAMESVRLAQAALLAVPA